MTRFTTGPAGSPGFLLWNVSLSWHREVGSVLKPLDLTHVQFVLLASTWWLSDHAAAEPAPAGPAGWY